MPQIQPYQQQVTPTGPVGVQRASPEDFGAGAAQAVQGFGRSVGQFGEVMAQRAAQKDVSDINAKMAQAHADLTTEYQKQLQQGTLNTEDFSQMVQDKMDQIQQGVNTAHGRLTFNEMSAQLQGHFLQQSATGQAELAGDRAVTDFQTGLEARSSALENDPSGFELARQQQESAIDSLVGAGGLPASKSTELKRKGETELAKSAIYGLAKMDPQQALHELDSGKWDQYVNGDQKRRMYLEVRQSANAQRVDQQRLDEQKREVLAQQQTKTQNDFLGKLEQGQLSTKDVLNSNLDPFGSGSKQTFIEMLDKKNKAGEDKIKTDPYVMTKLFNEIHADDSDPNKIRDENDLNKYFGKGLDMSDLNALRKEMQNKGTVEGDAEGLLKKNFLANAYSQIAKPDPLTKMPDPKGAENYQMFLSDFLKNYQDGLKNGKKPADMLDPKNDNYLGKNISDFRRSPQDTIKDVINRGNKQPPPDSTEMVLPDGSISFIPNKNVEEATKRGAKKKVN